MLKLRVLARINSWGSSSEPETPTKPAKRLKKRKNSKQQLSDLSKDQLYFYQTAGPPGPFTPYAINEDSLIASKICNDNFHAAFATQTLKHAQVLTDEGLIQANMINNNDLGIRFGTTFDSNSQKRLISLLYWWDSECVRLRPLLDEEAELDRFITQFEESGGEVAATADDDHQTRERLDELRFARETVRMRIRQLPSERLEDVESLDICPPSRRSTWESESNVMVREQWRPEDGLGEGDEPPAYECQRGQDQDQSSHRQDPPPYSDLEVPAPIIERA
jgi:hypothetical protein